MGNYNPKLPTKHVGTDKYITFFVSRSRQPTGADIRQPETGNYYSIGTVWQVGKAPTTGSEGELWMLSKIVANVAYWVLISNGVTPAMLSFAVPNGTSPVFPTAGGLTNITSSNSSVTITGSTNTVDFIARLATTSVTGIVELATQAESEFNTYGTSQVLQVSNIPFMFAKPPAIGSTTPNTGRFTTVDAIAPTDTYPGIRSTITTNSNNVQNTSIEAWYRCSVATAAGFGNAMTFYGDNASLAKTLLFDLAGVFDDTTGGSEDTRATISVLVNAVKTLAMTLYGTRLELGSASSRLRFGSGGVDILSGTGSPSGVVTAAKGSIYARTDGSTTNDRAYINTDGSTTWTAIVTVA